MQEFTSANTSINSTKAPAVYSNKVAQNIIRNKRVIDMGGGKYDTGIEAGKKVNAIVKVYDPYNRSESHNKSVMQGVYDVAIISNVLNVIKEADARAELLKLASQKADTILVTVYAGNGSGIGKQSQKDCWQENRKLDSYIAEIEQATGYSVKKRGTVLVSTK